MPNSTGQSLYPLTSNVLFRTLQEIAGKKDSIAALTESIPDKEQNVWVYVKLLSDSGLIVTEPLEKDKRVKRYSLDLKGLLKFYIEWVNENKQLSAKEKEQFAGSKSFTDEFEWYMKEQLHRLNVQNLERAFLTFSTNVVMNIQTRQMLRDSLRVQSIDGDGNPKIMDVQKKLEKEILGLSGINDILLSIIFGGVLPRYKSAEQLHSDLKKKEY